MNNYVKLIVFDVAMAIIIVVLYSPGLLALRPTDPGILRPGLSIFLGIVIAAALIYVNYSVLRTRKYEHLDATGDVDSYELTEVLKRYVSAPVVGEYASTAMDEIARADKKKKSLHDIVSGKFQKGTLSWDKFIAVIDSACQTVYKNAALLANRVQAFDVDEYRKVSKMIGSNAYKQDEIPDEVQEEQWKLLQNSLADMRGVVAANERLLLELDKFSIELGQLESASSSDQNNEMLEEIRTLVSETKYYQ